MSDEKKNVLAYVDPARRDFLKRLLAGAAFAAPVIATFSIEALTAENAYGLPSSNTSNTTNITNQVCTGDLGYVGPTYFMAHVSVGPVFYPTENRVNGQVTLRVTYSAQSIVSSITGNITMVTGAVLTSVYILNQQFPATQVIALGGNTSFTITSSELIPRVVCDVDELADVIAAGVAVCIVQGTYNGVNFSAFGNIVPLPALA